MKRKQINVFQLLTLGFAAFSLLNTNAQDLMVNLKAGTAENYPISQVISLKFDGDMMLLRESDGTVTSWNLEDISSYSFDLTASLDGAAPLKVETWELTIFPNPTSDVVKINFSGEQSTPLSIDVFDTAGKLVDNLFNGQHENGLTQVVWNAKQDRSVQTGSYICRITTSQKTITKSIVIQ